MAANRRNGCAHRAMSRELESGSDTAISTGCVRRVSCLEYLLAGEGQDSAVGFQSGDGVAMPDNGLHAQPFRSWARRLAAVSLLEPAHLDLSAAARSFTGLSPEPASASRAVCAAPSRRLVVVHRARRRMGAEVRHRSAILVVISAQ